MFGRRDDPRSDEHRHTVTQPGISLAKGPAMIIGLGLVAAGLLGFLHNADLPSINGFPNGDPRGTTFAGIEMNGWTNWITIAAGALLLFGVAQHHLAKVMSLIVGGVLIACAVIGLVTGDVLGLAASNGWTEIIWAIVGVVLLLNTLAPRREREQEVIHRDARTAPAAAAPSPAAAHVDDDRTVAREHTAVHDRAVMPPPPAPDERHDPVRDDGPVTVRGDEDRERLAGHDHQGVPDDRRQDIPRHDADRPSSAMPPADAPGERTQDRPRHDADRPSSAMPPPDAPGSEPAEGPTVIRDDADRERLRDRHRDA